ncbi:sporulation integral membrane protein YlbJ [Gracilibacillus timonensis]|uniref:sporulation integral membrane protein YlbJ n=1 Tax=Gracilibacillus timonensis TaxID=1816696 RepID=UPI0037098166
MTSLREKLPSLLYATAALFMAVMIIIYPQAVLQASQKGLEIWASIVFPSLLPFFIMAELLIAFGVVHFIGVLFEPIMRPLFNVPGVGGFVWTMGMASGYPSGAKYTARLRQEKQISQIEAERLVSFTNASNPLFIIGAVGIGFLHDAKLGILLALTHYLSNFFVGICMRFFKRGQATSKARYNFSITKAFEQLHQARIHKQQALGKILGEAVTQSIETLLKIGGFIILFSVITEILSTIQLAEICAQVIAFFLQVIQLPVDLSLPLFTGIFELTIGASAIAQTEVPLFFQAIAISIILAFNGFSVQAQVASILAETDIRFLPYFFARLLHAFFAGCFIIVLYLFFYSKELAKPALSLIDLTQTTTLSLETFGWVITFFALLIYLYILLFKFFHQSRFNHTRY